MLPRQHFTIHLADGGVLELGSRTLVMGVVKVTPDSFADGGERFDPDIAIAAALQMIEDGADIIDVGGESTRPGAAPLDAAEEWRRVGPVLAGLGGRVRVPISVDTYKAAIAERALDAGATIVNDISALAYDPLLASVIAKGRAAVVLMHNRGRSESMYDAATYTDVIAEVREELAARVAAAEAAGIARDRIIVDPGFGFAKRAEQTLTTLARLGEFASLGLPILAGPSRKSFLKIALGDVPPADRVLGTAAAVTASILGGAHIVRVHDVKPMVQVSRVADAILHGGAVPRSV